MPIATNPILDGRYEFGDFIYSFLLLRNPGDSHVHSGTMAGQSVDVEFARMRLHPNDGPGDGVVAAGDPAGD
jgi:hypothetical protein